MIDSELGNIMKERERKREKGMLSIKYENRNKINK